MGRLCCDRSQCSPASRGQTIARFGGTERRTRPHGPESSVASSPRVTERPVPEARSQVDETCPCAPGGGLSCHPVGPPSRPHSGLSGGGSRLGRSKSTPTRPRWGPVSSPVTSFLTTAMLAAQACRCRSGLSRVKSGDSRLWYPGNCLKRASVSNRKKKKKNKKKTVQAAVKNITLITASASDVGIFLKRPET